MTSPCRTVFSVLFLLISCGTPHPASSTLDTGPTMIEPGIVTTSAPEFSFTMSHDGKELFFDRATADRSRFSIMTSRAENGRWSLPVVAAFSGQYRDVDPFLTPDGHRLYFSSDRPVPPSASRNFNTWYVERTANGWSQPINAGTPLDTDSAETFVSVSRDGSIAFGSSRAGGQRIYLASPSGNSWTVPQALPLPDGAGNPALSPSGRFILFVMDVPGARADIFISCRQGDIWESPRPLTGLVNSHWADFAPFVDAAEQTLFFTSERPGLVGVQPDSVRPPGDLYRVSLDRAGASCRH